MAQFILAHVLPKDLREKIHSKQFLRREKTNPKNSKTQNLQHRSLLNQ